MTTAQAERARIFLDLHHADDVLVLPNAWDAVSAMVLAQAGFPAIATASAAVSWTRGVKDGEGLARADALDAVRLMAGAVDVPVTADIEKGFGETPQEVGATITEVIAAGAIGINIEDSIEGGQQRGIPDMKARIAAARAAADAAKIPLVINARVDAYLLGKSGDDVYAETIARAAAWVEAGADSIFVPGPKDRDLIGKLAKDIAAPLNVIVIDESTLSVAKLQALGVARVSTGPRLMQCVLGALQRAAASIREDGDFRFMAGAANFAEIQNAMG
ncbi:MAG: isocitrate lyase/PEP mutase family protein [Hyphomicrobiaceae bacterium]